MSEQTAIQPLRPMRGIEDFNSGFFKSSQCITRFQIAKEEAARDGFFGSDGITDQSDRIKPLTF
jgi:hypothetical protein